MARSIKSRINEIKREFINNYGVFITNDDAYTTLHLENIIGGVSTIDQNYFPIAGIDGYLRSSLRESANQIIFSKEVRVPSLITDSNSIFIGEIRQSSAHQTVSILNTGTNELLFGVASLISSVSGSSNPSYLKFGASSNAVIQSLVDETITADPIVFDYTVQNNRVIWSVSINSNINVSNLTFKIQANDSNGVIVYEKSNINLTTGVNTIEFTDENDQVSPFVVRSGEVLYITLEGGASLLGTTISGQQIPYFAINQAVYESISLIGSDDGNLIKTTLETLTGAARLDASAIKNLPAAGITSWRHPIEANNLTGPPPSPSTGERFIVASVATGDWIGQENNIAEWNGSSWDFQIPSDGWAVVNKDNDIIYIYNLNLTSWVQGSSFNLTAHSVTELNDVTNAGSGQIITSAERTKLSGIEQNATVDQTAAEIRDSLQTLTNNDRLDYTAIKNLPPSRTDEEIEDIIGAKIIAGTGINVSYNDTSGETTISSTGTAFPSPSVHNFSTDISDRVDLNTDLNTSHVFTFDISNRLHIQSLTAIVTGGDNITMTIPTVDGTQTQNVTLTGIDTSTSKTITILLRATDSQGTNHDSNTVSILVQNAQTHEQTHFGTVLSTEDQTNIDFTTDDIEARDNAIGSWTVSGISGTGLHRIYFAVPTSDSVITRISQSGFTLYESGLGSGNQFTLINNVTINSNTYNVLLMTVSSAVNNTYNGVTLITS